MVEKYQLLLQEVRLAFPPYTFSTSQCPIYSAIEGSDASGLPTHQHSCTHAYSTYTGKHIILKIEIFKYPKKKKMIFVLNLKIFKLWEEFKRRIRTHVTPEDFQDQFF